MNVQIWTHWLQFCGTATTSWNWLNNNMHACEHCRMYVYMYIRSHILKFDPDICWLHRFFVPFSQFIECSLVDVLVVSVVLFLLCRFLRSLLRTIQSVCQPPNTHTYNTTYTYDRFSFDTLHWRIFGSYCFGKMQYDKCVLISLLMVCPHLLQKKNKNNIDSTRNACNA